MSEVYTVSRGVSIILGNCAKVFCTISDARALDMEHDINIFPYTGLILVVTVIGIVLRSMRQPHVVVYILAGITLGPHALSFVTDPSTLSHLGALGVVLLLFFVGMEVSLPRLVSNWKVAIIGTFCQILISIGVVWVLGFVFTWNIERVLVLGCVISLSSTAVVVKVLQEKNEYHSQVGNDALGILLVQDLAIVPMLVVINFIGGGIPGAVELTFQAAGACLMLGLMIWLVRKESILLPIPKIVRQDKEIQVFVALLLCFGLATLTEWFHLSAALGAFLAGIIVSIAKETSWVHKSIEPFKVVFVGMFFVSVGMLINLDFMMLNPWKIGLLVLAVLFSNTFINAAILRVMGRTVRESIYVGALLAQIGELSFLLAAASFRYHIISEFAYQATIATIAISLLVSPAWIFGVGKALDRCSISSDSLNEGGATP